jgi:retrotransposon gag protein
LSGKQIWIGTLSTKALHPSDKEGLQKQRRRDDRAKIETWDKLKKHLRKKYVPNNYKHQLYLQWSTLNQGGRSVSEYIQEWEKLVVLCEINETNDLKEAKFNIAGLREDIGRKLMLIPNLVLQLAFNMAT